MTVSNMANLNINFFPPQPIYLGRQYFGMLLLSSWHLPTFFVFFKLLLMSILHFWKLWPLYVCVSMHMLTLSTQSVSTMMSISVGIYSRYADIQMQKPFKYLLD